MVGLVETVVTSHVESVLDWVWLYAGFFAWWTCVLPHYSVNSHLYVLQWHFGPLHQVFLLFFQLITTSHRLLVQNISIFHLHFADLMTHSF